jgi:peroxiredoxin
VRAGWAMAFGLVCVSGRVLCAEDGGMELVWRSGEKLSGRVIRATEEEVIFQPEVATVPGLFPEAAEIRLARVDELRATEGGAGERTEAFWMRLRDGSRFLVDVAGLEDGWVKVKSALLGDGAEVRLADVAAIERARGEGVLFFGVGHEPRWTESPRVEVAAEAEGADPFAAEGQPAAPRVLRVKRNRQAKSGESGQVLRLWQRVPEGGLRTVSWASSLTAPFDEAIVKSLPKKLFLELRLRAESSPRFAFSLVGADGAELRVETWEDRLVLREGGRYRAVTRRMAADAKAVGVRVLWDTETHEARLLSESGEEIAMLPAGASGKVERVTGTGADPFATEGGGAGKEEAAGVTIENLGRDLTVEAVNLMAWGGIMPDAPPAGGAYAQLGSGRIVKGKWVALRDGQAVFQAADGGELVRVPVSEVMRIEPDLREGPGAELEVPGRRWVELFSQSEEWVRGGFEGMAEEGEAEGRTVGVRLRHGSFRKGCGLDLAQLRSVVWDGVVDDGGPGTEFPERLQVGAGWVSGRMVATDDILPRWLFDGAVRPVRLDPERAAVIERDPKLMAAAQSVLAEGAVFVALRSGDVFEARVDDVSQAGLKFLAPGIVPMTLAKSVVRGLLIPSEPIETKGFQDRGWRPLRGNKVILDKGNEGEILLEPGDALGHPAMMSGDGFDLVLKEGQSEGAMNGVAGLRMTLFARGLESNAESLRLLVAFVGEEIYCGDEGADGQMRHQGQVMRSGPEANVQVRALEDRVLVRVNGREVVSVPISEEMKAGSGLILEPGELWGNAAQALRVAGFEARQSLYRGRVPQVEEEVRRQVLTIPRSRGGELPGQVLIAPTGDLLRGSVESWNEVELSLRWGLDVWRVPRERVAAVVLLESPAGGTEKKEGAVAAGGAAAGKGVIPHWLLLANGGRLGVRLTRWGADEVVGQHPVMGRVVVPAAAVRSVRVNQPPPEMDAMKAITGWQIKLAEAPQIATETEGEAAQVGTDSKSFTLPLLEGGEFVLEKYRGKVVVLDFWASWCGPCLKALPELMEALKGMPSGEVQLIGVNQGEPAAQVKTFLTTRRWKLMTVLDADQAVGKQFGVEGIPHTVVIGSDGKIVMVKSGYSAEAAGAIAAKVRELLKKE